MSLLLRSFVALTLALLLSQCASRGVLLGGPPIEERNAAIANEATGDFYYGRRYHVEKTRFWGYLREPRQSPMGAKLVMMREDKILVPDRLPEDGPKGQRHGYDNNYEYRVTGYYTGSKAYDPNTNQILPVFMPTSFDVVDKDPGWLFTPEDRYHPNKVSLRPRRTTGQ